MLKAAVLLAALLTSATAFAASNEPILASVLWSEDAGFHIAEELSKSPKTVAWGNFTNAINSTGWSYLEIKTDSNFPDKVQVKYYLHHP